MHVGAESRSWLVRQARLVALTAFGAALCIAVLPAESLASSAPSIASVSTSGSEDTATLEASIRPEGLETKYEFWLQYPACPSTTNGGCESIVTEQVGQGYIPAGHLEEAVSANLISLRSNDTYTFWVSATNSDGTKDSYPLQFTTTSPQAGYPVSIGGGKKAEFEAESWNGEGGKRAEEEASRLAAEEQAKKKEEEERPAKEAAERAAKERAIREAGERAGREAARRELLTKSASVTVCLVPSLKGDSLAVAHTALRKAHCKLGKVTRPHRHQAPLIVTSQSHPKGADLPGDTAIAIQLGARRPARD